jgi:hypothetical protein
MSGARKAVIQSSPADCSSSVMRLDDHSAFPDQHHAAQTRALAHWSIWTLRVLGSAVLPANTPTTIGQPSGVHSTPKTIYNLLGLPSRL